MDKIYECVYTYKTRDFSLIYVDRNFFTDVYIYTWIQVNLRRVQFVGACNPPADAGRVTLSPRFLRHAPLLLVDYPTEASLRQIYR
jgi:dynein heavy chain 1